MPIVVKHGRPAIDSLLAYMAGQGQRAEREQERAYKEALEQARLAQQAEQADLDRALRERGLDTQAKQFDKQLSATERAQQRQQALSARGQNISLLNSREQRAAAAQQQQATNQANLYSKYAAAQAATQQAAIEAEAERQKREEDFANEQAIVAMRSNAQQRNWYMQNLDPEVQQGVNDGSLRYTNEQKSQRKRISEALSKLDADKTMSPEEKIANGMELAREYHDISNSPQQVPPDELPVTLEQQLEQSTVLTEDGRMQRGNDGKWEYIKESPQRANKRADAEKEAVRKQKEADDLQARADEVAKTEYDREVRQYDAEEERLIAEEKENRTNPGWNAEAWKTKWKEHVTDPPTHPNVTYLEQKARQADAAAAMQSDPTVDSGMPPEGPPPQEPVFYPELPPGAVPIGSVSNKQELAALIASDPEIQPGDWIHTNEGFYELKEADFGGVEPPADPNAPPMEPQGPPPVEPPPQEMPPQNGQPQADVPAWETYPAHADLGEIEGPLYGEGGKAGDRVYIEDYNTAEGAQPKVAVYARELRPNEVPKDGKQQWMRNKYGWIDRLIHRVEGKWIETRIYRPIKDKGELKDVYNGVPYILPDGRTGVKTGGKESPENRAPEGTPGMPTKSAPSADGPFGIYDPDKITNLMDFWADLYHAQRTNDPKDWAKLKKYEKT